MKSINHAVREVRKTEREILESDKDQVWIQAQVQIRSPILDHVWVKVWSKVRSMVDEMIWRSLRSEV